MYVVRISNDTCGFLRRGTCGSSAGYTQRAFYLLLSIMNSLVRPERWDRQDSNLQCHWLPGYSRARKPVPHRSHERSSVWKKEKTAEAGSLGGWVEPVQMDFCCSNHPKYRDPADSLHSIRHLPAVRNARSCRMHEMGHKSLVPRTHIRGHPLVLKPATDNTHSRKSRESGQACIPFASLCVLLFAW